MAPAGEMRALPVGTIQRLFGAPGLLLHERCRGRDTAVVSEREVPLSISRETSFHHDTTDPREIEGMLESLARMLCAYRRVETKSGDTMPFLTLADRSGRVECVLFPGVFHRYAREIRAQIVRVEGRVDETLDAVTLVVEHAVALA